MHNGNDRICSEDSTADPKVSVIIPAFNLEKYIARAMKSVLLQSYHNLELIVVDDGSEDSTLSEINKVVESDSRTTVIHKENGGVSSARNMGIAAASGDYCIFLDGDDWLLPDAVSTFVSVAKASLHNDLICCNREYARDTGIGKIELYGANDGQEQMRINARDARLLFGSRTVFSIQNVCYKMFSLDIIRRNNLVFSEGITNKEDGLFLINYLYYVDGITYTPKCNWVVYQRSGSAMRTSFRSSWTTGVVALNMLLDKYGDDGDFRKVILREKAKLCTFLIIRGSTTRQLDASRAQWLRRELSDCRLEISCGKPDGVRLPSYVVAKFLPIYLARLYGMITSAVRQHGFRLQNNH